MIAAGFLVPVIEALSRLHPRMRFHVQQVYTPNVEFPELEERKVDLVLARLANLPVAGRLNSEPHAEVVLDDPFSVVVGRDSKWGRRRRVDLADLADEPWILPPPRLSVATFSIHLRNNLVGNGHFVTALLQSVLRLSRDRYSLKVLPLKLTDQRSPVAVLTLRNRTLGPAVRLFIDRAREIAASIGARPAAR